MAKLGHYTVRISASLWSADLARLGEDVRRVTPYVDSFHIDVSDGWFTDALLFFPDLVAAVRPYTTKPFVAHLMVREPHRFVERFQAAGVSCFVIHPEACSEGPANTLQRIREQQLGAGVALTDGRYLRAVVDVLPLVDCVVVMGTELGVKGVQPRAEVYQILRRLRGEIARRDLPIAVVADGGIRRETVPKLLQAGADEVVAGSLLFENDPATITEWIRSLGNNQG